MTDERRLRQAIDSANLPSLLMSLYQLSGDPKWLEEPFLPRRPRGIDDDDTGGLSDAAQATVREGAVHAVLEHAAGRPAVVPEPDEELLQQMMSVCVGEQVPQAFAPMIADEMGFADRRVHIADSAGNQTAPSVAIIGAGIGGLTAALELRDAGAAVTIFERNADVGGVWQTNRYPGAGVDTPSFLYSWGKFPCAWTAHFAKRDEVLGYIGDYADDHGLRNLARFDTSVDRCRWDAEGSQWVVDTSGPDGAIGSGRFDYVVCAVGVFSAPALPDLPGLADFQGPLFHSSQWPADLDVTNQRVAVVGSGASAMQIVPAIRERAAAVAVFQRSPQWIAPAAKYFTAIEDDVHFAMDRIPFYRGWYRFHVGWLFGDKRHALLKVDPDWVDRSDAISPRSERLRSFLVNYITTELDGRPELIAASIPDYPPYAKRLLLDNGWYRSLLAPNVTLYDEPVAELTADSVRTESDATWRADVVVMCTGFEAVRFVQSVDVVGAGGRTLREVWADDDARAHLGMMMPGFPNLFFVYGPNTNSGGGSYFSLADSQAQYIARVIVGAQAHDAPSVAPSREAFDRYNEELDAAHASMIWSHPGLRSYYRNAAGRVVVNMPWRGVDYWHMISEPDFDQLELGRATS